MDGSEKVVTRRAVAMRIRRRVPLRRSRGRWEELALGEYYLFDRGSSGRVERCRVDIEALARELEVLRPEEQVESKEGEQARELANWLCARGVRILLAD